ncbi:low molecular weight phosphotyrosine protein phosphatase [Mariniphaga sediminis]|uniref:Low molecular weight phosphotyrosine protein phosphatase n=1 Tax=Mariniphaga sediminis TaxID=1628158 RepID=A0A399D0K8_9BACT|nr:low molecular weight protein-tyrosine-phosphatase [Mariniphaga sediminis]RIH65394.1 low molecular weight phosphotyrosine protein phosphatase [Mariniphaga sediminis]
MNKKRILFVCLGNICRSPSAEAVFTGMVNKEGLSDQYEIDSAGTGGWHVGEPADRRMQKHAVKRGYDLTSISRKFNPEMDFDRFDLIIGMDDENALSLKNMARSEDDLKKIKKMTDFSKEWSYTEVPDPYYGGEDGFELVLDLLEDACKGLLEKTKK